MYPLCLLLIGLSLGEGSDQIVYKRVDTYDWVYDDSGTGAKRDVSIWRPKDYESGYYPLGDTAVASRSAPTTSAIMVRDVNNGDLKKPRGFVEIWNDRKSGGKHDVRVMRMIAPSGFKCIGHVAVLGYDNSPDRTKYRCVRTTLTTTGRYEKIWTDKGSGAKLDAGFFGNRQAPDSADGMDANTFTSVQSHSMPSGSPRLLNGAFLTNRAHINPDMADMALTVYQTPELEEIWNDRKSGAKSDISVWRSQGPSGSYSLGDIAIGQYDKPTAGFVVKALKDDALMPAESWRQIWNDRGSGARWDGAFWQPICPYLYRPLGYVAMRNHDSTPPANAFRCVKTDYTVSGRWDAVWKDNGSGAKVDVGVWKGVPSGNGQGLEAMMAVANHGSMDRTAFVLLPSVVNYVIGKPAIKYTLQNVQYNFDDRSIGFSEPESLARTVVENRGTTVQTMTRALSYSYEESVSWGGSTTLAIGVTTEVSAGIPSLGGTKVSLSTEVTKEQNWGESSTEKKSDTTTVTVVVQPESSKGAVVTGRRYQMDIPYTARLVTTYSDGTTGVNNNFSGVFRGVQVNEVRVIYEPDVSLNV